MKHWDVKKLVFIDESGVNLSMTRTRARSPCGERVVDKVPGGRWESYSVIAALRQKGIVAPMLIPGAMNGQSLRTWVKKCLCPRLRRGDIVIWDNLGIHNDSQVLAAIEARGATLEFLPAYSPELNPIEMAWSKVKAGLRAAGARTLDTLLASLGNALRSVTRTDCRGWFSHAGYVVT